MSMYFRRGQSNAWFVPTIGNVEAPTAAAISGGTELGDAIASLDGFGTSLNRINQPVMKKRQEVQIDGPQTFDDTSITLLDDDGDGADADSAARVAARTALGTEGTTGYIVIALSKVTVAAADKVQVWPIRVGAVNPVLTLDTEPARTIIAMVVTGTPAKAATVA